MRIPLYPKQLALLERAKQFGQRRFVGTVGGLFLLITFPIFCAGFMEKMKPQEAMTWIETIASIIYASCGSAFLEAFLFWHLLAWLRRHSVARN